MGRRSQAFLAIASGNGKACQALPSATGRRNQTSPEIAQNIKLKLGSSIWRKSEPISTMNGQVPN
eukprot:3235003-Amphidinium_carterae.2